MYYTKSAYAMAQWLAVHADLSEDQSLVPSTHIRLKLGLLRHPYVYAYIFINKS